MVNARKNHHAWAVLGLALCLGAVSSTTYAASACTTSAEATYKACQLGARSDALLALAACVNESDQQKREACKEAADDELADASDECGEQNEARLALCKQLGEAPYDPRINPANFVNPLEIGKSVPPNPYHPLVPGSVWIYQGPEERIRVEVTNETKEILGVTTIVVRDVVRDDEGERVEDTDDWIAQDNEGNVWYFGELSQSYEDGELVSLEGSWTAGVDGARPGILFKANPAVGDLYRQEFLPGEAEDLGKVLHLDGQATVPATRCNSACVVTADFSPLEPDARERKFYAPNVGLILELEEGERVELVRYQIGSD
jgi:hypothetical protein